MRSFCSIVLFITTLFCGLASSSAFAINQTYQVYVKGSEYYLKTDPNWVPISGDIFVIIPVYQEGEILKLSQINGTWQVQNISFGQFNSASPSILSTGSAGYADFNGDGIDDLSISLGASGNNKTIRFISTNSQSSDFALYDSLGINIESPTLPTVAPLPPEDIASSSIGTLGGEFRVDESGAATYTVPIAVPQGIAGVTPQLALSYSSAAGNGIMGMGWSVSGLSGISRCRQTYEQDLAITPISLTNDDRFCLDGQKLVAVNGEYGGSDTEYRTEMDSQVRVKSHDNSGTGPAYFTVERADGSTSYYGSTLDSVRSAGDSTVINWMISQIQDNVSNSIDFVYNTTGFGTNELLISSIIYSGHSIDFNYNTNTTLGARSDQHSGYLHGLMVESTARLDGLSVNYHDGAIQTYNLVYHEDTVSGVTQLDSIEQCAGTTCLPKINFTWTASASRMISSLPSSCTYANGCLASNKTFFGLKPIDYNGDGFVDISYVVGNSSGDYELRLLKNENGTFVKDASHTASFNFRVSEQAELDWMILDANGDGKQDILLKKKITGSSEDKWYLFLAYPDGVNDFLLGNLVPFTNTEGKAPKLSLIDFNADGLVDIISGVTQNEIDSYNLRLNKGGSFGTIADGIEIIGTSEQDYYRIIEMDEMVVGDFNGDGVGDVITKMQRTSAGTTHLITSLCDPGRPCAHAIPLTYWQAYVTRFDENGEPFLQAYQKLGYGSGQNSVAETWGFNLIPGDINGDGLTDLAYKNIYTTAANGKWKYIYSTGTGFKGIEYDEGSRIEGTQDEDLRFVQLMDINADGRADLVYLDDSDTNNTYLYFHASAVDGFKSREAISGKNINNNYSFTDFDSAFLLDIDADSNLDLLTFDYSDKKVQSYNSLSREVVPSRTFIGGYEVVKTAPIPVAKLESITNGFGSSTSVTYSLLTNSGVYTIGYSANTITTYGNGSHVFDIISPMYVVSEVVSAAPSYLDADNSVSVEYQYESLRVQAGGRGMLGFEKIRTYDPQTKVTTETIYHQDYPYIGMPKETRRYLGKYLDWYSMAETQKLSFASNTYDVALLQDGKTSFPYLDVSTEIQYSLNDLGTATTQIGMITTDNSYTIVDDNHANLSKVVVGTSQPYISSSSVTTENTFTDESIPNWWLGRVSTTKVKHFRSDAFPANRQTIERESSFEYSSSTGMLEKEIIQPSGSVSEKLITLHCYDTVGNKENSITYSSNVGAVDCSTRNIDTKGDSTKVFRYSGVTYDNEKRYVESSYDALFDDISTVVARNSFGQVTKSKDINGVVSIAAYDSFGRQYASSNSLGQFSQTTRRLAANATAIGAPSITESYYFVERSVATGAPTSYAYFDQVGRQVAAVKQGFTANEWIYQYSHYDKYGRILQQSIPSKNSTPSYWTSTDYDDFGRPQTITSADNTESTIEYNGLSSKTTVVTGGDYYLSQESTEVKNILGETVSVIDNLDGDITYYYDATGNLTKVIGVDNVAITTVFDSLGRKTSMTDPDKGAWTYTYNALGQLITQTDAKNYKTT
jgi:YD repeat-containing protein